MIEDVAFIGLGNMGLPMARHLLASGHRVTVYNRTLEKAQSLIHEGAEVAKLPVDVLKPKSIIFTIVSDDQAVEEIVFGADGIGKSLRSGHVHVSMSTISPQTSRKLAKFHQEKGAEYLVATVSGRPEGAIAQKLWIFLAGAQSTKERVLPLLNILGQKIFDIGDDPALGNVIKLCGNFLILAAIEALAEASAFAEKNGLSTQVVGQVFSESLFACPVYKTYAEILAKEQFYPPGFQLPLGFKDINLLRKEAETSLVPMPLAHLLYQRLLTALAKDRGQFDWSIIARSSFEEAGWKDS